MINSLIAKIKGFLLAPVKTFQQTKDEEPKAVFTYFAVLLFVYSLLSAILTTIGTEGMQNGILPVLRGVFLLFFALFIGFFIASVIFAAWLHLVVYLFGGRNGIMQTMKALFYGNTPTFLFGWIPVIGIFFSIWALILSILGLRELQEISLEKSTTACVIAVVIPIIALVFLGLFLFINLIVSSGMDPAVLSPYFKKI